MLLVFFCVYSIKSSIYLTHCWILYFFFLTILIAWFSSRDMSRIELDCKNYKCFDNNKCDRSCKKLLNKARLRTVQGLGLKNAEIKKHDESNISDQTCKHPQAYNFYRWRPHREGMFIARCDKIIKYHKRPCISRILRQAAPPISKRRIWKKIFKNNTAWTFI